MDNDCELTLNKKCSFEECSLFLTLLTFCFYVSFCQSPPLFSYFGKFGNSDEIFWQAFNQLTIFFRSLRRSILFTVAIPSVGLRSMTKIRIKVILPALFGPNNLKRPLPSSRSISIIASFPLKHLLVRF